mgnify:CR=1 FL=1
MIIRVNSLADLPQAAQKLLNFCKNRKKIAFYANMGAGKTTFIKLLCQYLAIKDTVSSPTYALVNVYQNDDKVVYHLDLYRLKDINEALDIGIEDYLFDDNYCFIEWPQVIEPLLEEDVVRVNIRVNTDNSRDIIVQKSFTD